ncbi:MAG: hypothetical protein GC165_05155 [Armatimonadetes bacterium]|nr:hypothetical protein [Armatimonadota bacterium]
MLTLAPFEFSHSRYLFEQCSLKPVVPAFLRRVTCEYVAKAETEELDPVDIDFSHRLGFLIADREEGYLSAGEFALRLPSLYPKGQRAAMFYADVLYDRIKEIDREVLLSISGRLLSDFFDDEYALPSILSRREKLIYIKEMACDPPALADMT